MPPTGRRASRSQRLARIVGRWITVLPMMDPGEMTVSEEDKQFLRHRVFCDLRLPGGRRCVLRDGHDGECSRRLRR
ncbi:hypothetical protein GKC29_18550 [Micromonospora sp. WMMC415]|uniref:hypothetical protein n=1 Tax=Micromonospora sp. WMMC415 TaxID=2675222 RepID=UPI0012B48D34|nr:hypothetical protein [Micromonospora sp. WMMC415]QGN48630.1 hypothetical protein GKC29_18550 [Micromonospora sp. WMMC415]